jgi:hypothetical protein
VVIGQFIGQDGTSLIEQVCGYYGLSNERFPWTRIVVATVMLLVLARVAFALTLRNPRLDDWRGWCVAACVIAAIVIGNTTATWLFELLNETCKPYREGWWWQFLWFVFWSALWTVVYFRIAPSVRYMFDAPNDFMEIDDPAPPAGPVTLVMHVSPHNSLKFDANQGMVIDDQNNQQFKLRFRSLDEDIRALDGVEITTKTGIKTKLKWSWQQLLRGIVGYVGDDNRQATSELKIFLVGSKGPENLGTFQLLDDCIGFLKRYPELRDVRVEKYPQPLDFEDYNEVKGAIRKLLAEECKRVGEKNVFVDITGGPKTTSIAAAAATMGANGMFQYVQTSGENRRIVFDIHPQAVLTPGN